MGLQSFDRYGEHYEGPIEVFLNNSKYRILKKGDVLQTSKKAYCMTDLHYNRKSDPIPMGQQVVINYFWINAFYQMANASFGNRNYDIDLRDLEPIVE